MKLKVVALGFDRGRDTLKKTVLLENLGVEDLRRIFELHRDDPIVGATFPVERAGVRRELEKHAHEPLDASVDWFAEVQAS
jgi:hypothetical protein